MMFIEAEHEAALVDLFKHLHVVSALPVVKKNIPFWLIVILKKRIPISNINTRAQTNDLTGLKALWLKHIHTG